jgi:hypothetical protein
VKTTAHLNAHPAALNRDGLGAPDRSTGAVERSQDPIAQSLDLSSPESFDLTTYGPVMAVQEGAPGAVAQSSGSLGRRHDVGEHHRGEHAVNVGVGPRGDWAGRRPRMSERPRGGSVIDVRRNAFCLYADLTEHPRG